MNNFKKAILLSTATFSLATATNLVVSNQTQINPIHTNVTAEAATTYDQIVSTKKVKYQARINGLRQDGVYFFGPYRTSVMTTSANGHASQYNNWKMSITKETKTTRATYVYGTDQTGKRAF